MAAPAFEMASMAYSTWYSRPSGLKIVVLESYRLAMAALYESSISAWTLPESDAQALAAQSCYPEN